jgi:hypothetical protein
MIRYTYQAQRMSADEQTGYRIIRTPVGEGGSIRLGGWELVPGEENLSWDEARERAKIFNEQEVNY